MWPSRNNVVTENLSNLPNVLGRSAFSLLMGSSSLYAGSRQFPPLNKDCVYFTGLFRPVLKDGINELSKYPRCASTALALGVSDDYDTFRSNWYRIEK